MDNRRAVGRFRVALAAVHLFLLANSFPVRQANLSAADFPTIVKAPRSTLRLPGLNAAVGLYRDPWGIPHIYAGSSEDAYFALGYLHAADRLFQMELFRRVAAKLSTGGSRIDLALGTQSVGEHAGWRSRRSAGAGPSRSVGVSIMGQLPCTMPYIEAQTASRVWGF